MICLEATAIDKCISFSTMTFNNRNIKIYMHNRISVEIFRHKTLYPRNYQGKNKRHRSRKRVHKEVLMLVLREMEETYNYGHGLMVADDFSLFI